MSSRRMRSASALREAAVSRGREGVEGEATAVQWGLWAFQSSF